MPTLFYNTDSNGKKSLSKSFISLLILFVGVSSLLLFSYRSKTSQDLEGVKAIAVSPIESSHHNRKVLLESLPIYAIDLNLRDPEYFLDTVVLPIESEQNALYRLQLTITPLQQ